MNDTLIYGIHSVYHMEQSNPKSMKQCIVSFNEEELRLLLNIVSDFGGLGRKTGMFTDETLGTLDTAFRKMWDAGKELEAQ